MTAPVVHSKTVGTLPEFQPDSGNFEVYLERFELFAAANDIAAEKKLQVFLTAIGETAYVTLRSLLLPKTPAKASYVEAVSVLKKHYTPKRSLVAERYRFNQRQQAPHESVADFIVELKKLASTCEFGNFLNDALRDRLVAGLRTEAVRCRLLALPDEEITWEHACKVAIAMEAASQDTKEMLQPNKSGASSDSTEVYWQRGTQKSPQKGKPSKAGRRKTSPAKKASQGTKTSCHRCAGHHPPVSCPFLTSDCFKCKKKGHIAKMCKTKLVHSVEPQEDRDLLTLCHVNRSDTPPFRVNVTINGKVVPMEIDTGAAVSIISEVEWARHFPNASFTQEDVKLMTYNGTPVAVAGVADVKVEYQGQCFKLPLVIAKESEGARMPTLFGRNWLSKIKLNWREVFSVQALERETPLTEKYRDVFNAGFGAIKGFKASIVLKENACPVFCKARSVPYALRERVEQDFANLEKAGVVYRVRHSKWATPLVIVPKKDGTELRHCGDYKITVNPAIEVDHYPLPLPEDIFATLEGGTVFSVIDLSKAYLQLELDEQAQELLTINTHMGLFRFRRLPYGVACAPAIFQAVMDQILQGMPGTACYLDDIVIAGVDYKQCYDRVEEVLRRLSEHGIKVNAKKCRLFQQRITYLGHDIDKNGLHPTAEKVVAIKEAPKPTSVTQLKAFLGLVNFYGKFLPNLATILEPLHDLLRKDSRWHWSRKCDEAFATCKKMLSDKSVLQLYDVKKPLQITCDASEYGLGAVLSHVENGNEKPIAFASRSLSPSERNYAQIEKEALSIVFAVKKFHKYLYGRDFNVLTDHQPLTTLLDLKRQGSAVATARVHRWVTFLANYRYKIKHKPGSAISHADALSRLPLPDTDDHSEDIFYFAPLNELPLTAKDIERETGQDKLLSVVRDMIWHGWKKTVPEQLKPFWLRRFELSVDNGCIVWLNRVVVPQSLHSVVLGLLHAQHLGITKMKAVARSMLWWPGMDSALEETVRKCKICQSVLPEAQPVPLTPWQVCQNPWERVHLDFAEEKGKMFLLAIDSYSKWLEIKPMGVTTAAKTIEVVRSWFAAHGLPLEVVTDNGPQFRAQEFEDFLSSNGVRHTLTPPYHPQSNGAAERAVQSTKKALLKQNLEDSEKGTTRSLQHRLDNFLFSYRTTPHTFTGRTPAELFLRRKLRTRLSLLRPDTRNEMVVRREKMKTLADKRRGRPRVFAVGDSVLVRSVRGDVVKWWLGRVTRVKSPSTYLVCVGNKVRFVHADHLRPSCVESTNHPDNHPECELPHAPDVVPAALTTERLAEPATRATVAPSASNEEAVPLRRSNRERRPPDRLTYDSF